MTEQAEQIYKKIWQSITDATKELRGWDSIEVLEELAVDCETRAAAMKDDENSNLDG